MLIITCLLIIILTITVAAYLWHIRRVYKFFSDRNIHGPKPTLFFGNCADLAKTKRPSISIHQWTQKYGSVFGYFEGHTPILVVSDPDLLQEIFVKSFSNFHSRRAFPLENRYAKDVHIFSATGLRWKRQRLAISPTFSSAKLKQMIPILHRSIDAFMSKMAEECKRNRPFDIYVYFKRFTMDTIWSCGFGLDTDMQNKIDDPYLVHSQNVFHEGNAIKTLVLLSLFVSELNTIWLKLHNIENFIRHWIRYFFPFAEKYIDEEPSKWIVKQAYGLIDLHEKIGCTDRTDLIQLMLESASSDDYISDWNSCSIRYGDNKMLASLKNKLTRPEIASNIHLFMVAAYETTSTALAYACYVLATHPEEQQKLQELIDAYTSFEDDDRKPSYGTLSKMVYLDMFIREVLRMYPIAPITINRQSTQSFYLKGDVDMLPAGTVVMTDIYRLHFDSNLWGPVDPHTFYPERFCTKRHPMAWIPFGIGARNCVGMRFALTELKLLLICLLKKYTIIDCGDQTRKPFENLKEYIVIAPDQVIVRLQERNKMS